MAISKQVYRLVRKSIVEGIRRNGERIFDLSQDNAKGFVPVDRGILRHSGYTRRIKGGVEIGYRAPYAYRVEFGQPEGRYTGTQVVHIKSHTAHTKYGTVKVPAHDVMYENKRLVRIRSKLSWSREELEASYGVRIPGDVTNMKVYGPYIFRVIEKLPARPGQYYLTRAVMKGILDLPKDIEWALSKVGEIK